MVHRINPLQDPRWDRFVQQHPKASIFHTRGWLESLNRTYGYTPFVLTTSAAGSDLTNGLLFCQVKSWLTGKRFVSVPFADHCDPLFEQVNDFHASLDWMRHNLGRDSRAHAELRPLTDLGLEQELQFRPCLEYRLHTLDLRPSLEQLSRAFDKDSIQRRLRRHESSPLEYEVGNNAELIDKFYHLQVLTRRRHRIPPQPRKWFRSLMAALGDSAEIRIVSKDGNPVAAILTLRHKNTVVYKYGCSDARYKHLAGTVYLFWRAIQKAKETGATTFDLGRSDLDNRGLIAFKSHWGATESPITYWRCPGSAPNSLSVRASGSGIGGYVISRLPDRLLILVGESLYKHVG
jgi:hypothetical protein